MGELTRELNHDPETVGTVTRVRRLAAVPAAADERSGRLDEELAGLDELETVLPQRASLAVRTWRSLWPKVAAFGLFILAWQLIVWSGWKSEAILPGPGPVFERFFEDIGNGKAFDALATTLTRAGKGYVIAMIIGVALGVGVARNRVLRSAIGSLLTGFQTMPSIAWFPMSIVLFQLSETAIFFVVVLGAAPSIAAGLITGIDHIPPNQLRAGRVLGAKGVSLYRHVILPAAMPGFVGGIKQGWAFAWRSLMAGELLVLIAGKPSLGARLQISREVSDYVGMYSTMIVILVVGMVLDGLVFGRLEILVRRRWGLIDSAA